MKKEDVSLRRADLRKAINDIVGLGFTWLGLRQADKSIKCGKCLGKDPSNCARCMGTGYLLTDFLVKGYMWDDVEGVNIEPVITYTNSDIKHIVLKYDRPVNENDFILRLDTDLDTGELRQPIKILTYYRIADTTSLIGPDSEVQFWKCVAQESTVFGK